MRNLIYASWLACILAVFLGALALPVKAEAAIPTSEFTNKDAPLKAQVVGIQWLNPLQRRDYSTEWQLLWTLGLVSPNRDDNKVKENPAKYSSLGIVGSIAIGWNGETTFDGYHHQYFSTLIEHMHDIYFSSSGYFYNAHSLNDKSTWRELAGIHVEYALPLGKFEVDQISNFVQEEITSCFQIGNKNFPNAWSRATLPDVKVTMGGANAGFSSLSAALDYLQAHPNETVWAMNWDAPSRPKDKQLNENMVLLVLAGPNYKTEREPLAWIGYPVARSISEFEKKSDLPPRKAQAWKATINEAARKAGKEPMDIGYVIHDANLTHPDSSERIGNLAQATYEEIREFDFAKQAFNTSALLGDMGAGSALTNVALGIAYANHIGKTVLVAGTTDLAKPTAVVVVPPAKVRPIDHEKPWFRARGGNTVFLMWWGLRHDAPPGSQGYSR
jgi:hypothetical protein